MHLSEADTKAKLIDPAFIEGAGRKTLSDVRRRSRVLILWKEDHGEDREAGRIIFCASGSI